MHSAIVDADIIYTDCWPARGTDEEQQKIRELFLPSQVTEDILRISPQDALFLPCPPAHRGQEGTNGVGIKVSWDAPSATGDSDVSGYRIEWKGRNQDYPDDQTTRQAFVENAPYTIDTTSQTPIEGDELTVRVAAVNGAGAGIWSEKIGWLPSHTDLELWLLMREYADEKQTTFPWVLETWNYLDRYEVPVEVGPATSGLPVTPTYRARRAAPTPWPTPTRARPSKCV